MCCRAGLAVVSRAGCIPPEPIFPPVNVRVTSASPTGSDRCHSSMPRAPYVFVVMIFFVIFGVKVIKVLNVLNVNLSVMTVMSIGSDYAGCLCPCAVGSRLPDLSGACEG